MALIKSKDADIAVITKAKDLCDYVFIVTESSPKRFRFTLVTRMQNYALDIVENVIMANEVYMSLDDREAIAAALTERRSLQKKAMCRMKLLGYLAHNSKKRECLTQKQYEQITLQLYGCQNLLGGWINSDDRRFAEAAGMKPMPTGKNRKRSPDIPYDAAMEKAARDKQAAAQQGRKAQPRQDGKSQQTAHTVQTASPQGTGQKAQTSAQTVQDTADDTVPWKQ